MVDKAWLERKQAEHAEIQRQAKIASLRAWSKSPMEIETTMTFKGYTVRLTDTFKDVKEYEKWLEGMQNSGFGKPEYKKREEVKEQFGIVTDITDSDKSYNGRKMFDIHVKLQDGKETKVAVFKAEDYLLEDVIFYHVNDKGFPALRRATRAETESYNIPF